jgi:hypothetical protein
MIKALQFLFVVQWLIANGTPFEDSVSCAFGPGVRLNPHRRLQDEGLSKG